MTSVRVAALDEVVPGRVATVQIDGRPAVLARHGDTVYACGAVCTHRGGPLGEGRLTGTRLVCPWHGWMFDVRTGTCLVPARGAALPTYPVRVQDGDVWVGG
jgi:nitrite reductase/ring-hydroxylating ferredoxin subunit